VGGGEVEGGESSVNVISVSTKLLLDLAEPKSLENGTDAPEKKASSATVSLKQSAPTAPSSSSSTIITNAKYAALALSLVALASWIWLLKSELNEPVFGCTSATPVVGVLVSQIQVTRLAYVHSSKEMQLGAIGLSLALWGHLIVYSSVFFLALFYRLAINGLVGGLILLPLQLDMVPIDLDPETEQNLVLGVSMLVVGISAMHAMSVVHAIFDYFPRIISHSIVFAIAILDQSAGCLLTNFFYNRTVWYAGWNLWGGWVRFPLLFCYDSRANGEKLWVGLPAGCRNPSYHVEALNCLCKNDVCSSMNPDGCNSFCDWTTSYLNIYRLSEDYSTCLHTVHIFFMALLFGIIFTLMHKLQKQLIINGTVSAGLYMWMNYGSGAVLDAVSGYWNLGLVAATAPAMVIFQNQVTTRITRSVGLDLSPPDGSIPLSASEALTMTLSAIRLVAIAMPEGAMIVVAAFAFRANLVAQAGGRPTDMTVC